MKLCCPDSTVNEREIKYLNAIPVTEVTARSGPTSLDIEYSLSQLLNPGLYVTLDIDSSSQHKYRRNVVPTSCEVMFPSFEVACEAFDRLRTDLDLVKANDECTVNWLKTPWDDERYWTRELGGVI